MFGGDLVLKNTEMAWIVVIFSSISINRQKMCTGTVIHKRWILTAAHCVEHQDKVIPPYNVHVGIYYSIVRSHDLSVQGVFVHPRYYNQNGSESVGAIGDIALIKTASEIPIDPGKLQFDGSFFPKDSCIIAGFGRKGLVHERRPTLHTMKVSVFSREGCSRITGDFDAFCLLVFRGVGPCIGDSGSPLICDGSVVGVLSRGRLQDHSKCGAWTVNGVVFYEQVARYYDWIREVQGNYSADSGSGPLLRGSSLQLFILMFILVL